MNAIVLSQNSFGLVPKVFDTIDVVFAFCKVSRMVDAVMAKAAHVKRVVGSVGIGINHTVRLDFVGNNWHQGSGLGVVDHHCVYLSMTFKDAKDNDVPCRASTALSFARTTKVALIQFNTAIEHLRAFLRQMPGNHLSYFLVEQDRGIGLDSKQVSSRTRRHFQNKKFQQIFLNVST